VADFVEFSEECEECEKGEGGLVADFGCSLSEMLSSSESLSNDSLEWCTPLNFAEPLL
jgi:hypothetical protein